MFSIQKLIFTQIVLCLCLLAVLSSADEYHPSPRQSRNAAKATLNPLERETEFWNTNAQNLLQAKITQKLNTNVAKNVIIFIGDGMSLETVVATRIMEGGEEGFLSFEKFPHFGLSKTYCINRQVADSACSATAYLSGVKGNYGTIGVNAKVPRYDCEAGLNETTHTKSIAGWAQDACKATGIVTTTRVTHASPAGNFANIANRDWENDAEITSSRCDPEKIDDIAEQLIRGEVGKNFNVILGCGRREFIPTTEVDEEEEAGMRTDDVNLIKEWELERNKDGKNGSYIWNRKQLLSIDIDNTDYLLGLFENNHCHYNADIESKGLQDDEPTLTDMVGVAIKMMQKNEEGYYLFIEGGRIDMAHHDTKARKALLETVEFAKAIALARSMTSEDDTLIVVTADHSHTLTINGYPTRGNDILGLSGDDGDDKKPYLTLSYANGPGYSNTYDADGERIDLTDVDTSSNDYRYSAAIPLSSETHGGDDVGVYASGPGSHLFVGNYEQNVIPYLAAYAAKIGEYFEPIKDEGGAGSLMTYSIALILARGSDILGLANGMGEDKMPYFTLSYANGPGYANTYDPLTGTRINYTNIDTSDNDFMYPATVPLTDETHAGEDVGVYASGPWAHLFVGNYEQNVIPYLAAFAGSLGDYNTYPQCQVENKSNSANSFFNGVPIIELAILIIVQISLRYVYNRF